MIGFSHRLHWKELKKEVDKAGRYILVRGFLFEVEITILGVYAPNSTLVNFWNNIFLLMEDIRERNILLLGDFNTYN